MTDPTKVTQSQEILDYMLNGNKINPILALNRFGCFRLAARIADIRHMGYKVESDMVSIQHWNGKNKKYKEYYIEQVS